MPASTRSPAETGAQLGPARLEAICAWAGLQLGRTFGTNVDVGLQEIIADFHDVPNKVLRLSVRTRGRGIVPQNVIVKLSAPASRHLEIEAANLRFLRRLAATREAAPALYAHDAEAGALLIEDLSSADSFRIAEILHGDSPQLAAEALEALQRTTGRIHAESAGLLAEYRRGIPEPACNSPQPTHPIDRIVPALRNFAGLASHWGLGIRGFDEEVRVVAAIIDQPGPFLVFTHGDATVLNAFHSQHGARLIDFELGAYRHALLEGTFSRIRYICSSRAFAVPLPIQRRMMAAYRDELSRKCTAARDDDRFNREFTAAAAAWLAVFCSWLPAALERDYKWGHASARQRIFSGIEHFVELAGETGEFPAIAAAAEALKRQLRQRWSSDQCELKRFPAFAH